MESRPFGSTGIDVSVIGPGAWQLGRPANWPDGPDEAGRGRAACLLSYDAVSTVIPGTRSVAQLESSLRAVDAPAPADAVAAIRSWYGSRLAAGPLGW